MRTRLARFASDESAATAIEYSLIATLVSIAIVVGATALGEQIDTMYRAIAEQFGMGEDDPSD
jgi:pilus assembly protein Flp/PilA